MIQNILLPHYYHNTPLFRHNFSKLLAQSAQSVNILVMRDTHQPRAQMLNIMPEHLDLVIGNKNQKDIKPLHIQNKETKHAHIQGPKSD